MTPLNRLTPALAATVLLTAVPAAGVAAAAPAPAPVERATTASQDPGPGMYKRYLLGNKWHGAWDDDGVKGIVKNFSKKRIIVRDSVADVQVDIWPGQAVVFYSDQHIHKFGSLVEGNGTWLQIAPYDDRLNLSEFRLSDPVFGKPDTFFYGPGRAIANQRTDWREGDSAHEITPTHKFWIKREPDSWREKHDTWNTSDWAAFAIHVDEI